MDDVYYRESKEAARQLYSVERMIHSPFFNAEIVLGPEGFRHLQVSAQGDRTREEQVQRFGLLPLALQILTTATTLQRYRRRSAALYPQGETRPLKERKMVQWWCFTALFLSRALRVKVVVRKVGDGKLHFWSVMAEKIDQWGEPKYVTGADWTSN
jgi:hypothetical protein